MVAAPPSDNNLWLLKQLGIDYAVHYDMHDLPDEFDALGAIRARYARLAPGIPLLAAGGKEDPQRGGYGGIRDG